MTLGNKIKTLRIEKGWNQVELGDKIGVTKQGISRYEHDVSVPVFEVLKKISKVFDVSLDYLVFDKEENVNLNDKELIRYFRTADNLSPQKKKLIKDMIKAVSESP